MSSEALEFIADDFLAADPDCPVFGLNLACVYPFPETARKPYTELTERLQKLDDGVYVYPFWETHLTLITFLNFSRFRRPDAATLQDLHGTIAPLVKLLTRLFDNVRPASFELEFGRPELSRKAALLPASNPSNEVGTIRQWTLDLLKQNPTLHERCVQAGMNIPGIIHSTIMRFKTVPCDASAFAKSFAAVAAATEPFSVSVREILLTTETTPYMREGKIIHRFPLAGAAGRD